MIVLHYTGMPTAEAAIERLCDATAQVSAHYLIHEDGRILAMVEEERRAWHAGVSGWAGRRRLNDVSIGIEIVNPGHDWGYRPFPEAQMRAVELLVGDIASRRTIPAARVVGHSDIAPARKADPGELFDWPRLAGQGLASAVPQCGAVPPDRDVAHSALAAIGYDLELADTAFEHVVTAFQRRFRPRCVDGCLDDETMGLIAALATRSAGT